MKMYGRASVAGLTGTITHSSLGTNSLITMQGLQATHNWKETIVKDPATGLPRRFLVDEEVRDLAIEILLESDGSTGHNTKAVAAGAAVYLQPYAIVTVSSSPIAALNATYLYVGGAKFSQTPDGDTKLSLNIRRYLDCSDAEHTALATAVS